MSCWSVPEAGANVLSDGDFESDFPRSMDGFCESDEFRFEHDIKYFGNASLHVISTSGGSTQGSAIWQKNHRL